MENQNNTWIMIDGVLTCTECKRGVATIELDKLNEFDELERKLYQDCLCPGKMIVGGEKVEDSPEVVNIKQQLGALS